MDFNNLKKVLIKEMFFAKKVFIVGHNNMDMDAFASVVGFSLICKKFKKKFYLVSDDVDFDYGIKKSLEKFNNIKFINSSDVSLKLNDKSLIIVLDTNKSKLICLDSLEVARNVIVIDHHDTNNDTIKTDYLYINKSASSTSEIITMLLDKFMIKIPSFYCTLLLSGIILDTNGLSYKLNRRTFYYCYYLLSRGADMSQSRELLKDNLSDYLKKTKLIHGTKVYGDVAIAVDKTNKIYTRKDLAITADILLTFQDIKASIVVAKIGDNEVGISARSIGDIDVNSLMGTFDGGGNKNEAAALVKDKSVSSIVKELLDIIEE